VQRHHQCVLPSPTDFLEEKTDFLLAEGKMMRQDLSFKVAGGVGGRTDYKKKLSWMPQ